jgi:hypothetical protein
MTVLEKLPLCYKITCNKSYLNIFNSNQDIGNLRFFVFLKLNDYLKFFLGAAYSLVLKELKLLGISRLSIIVSKGNFLIVFIFNSAWPQGKILT